MKRARLKTKPPRSPVLAGPGRCAAARELCRRIIFICALWVPIAGQAGDPYAGVLERSFATGRVQSNSVPPTLNLSAAKAKRLDLENAFKLATQQLAQGPQVTPAPPLPNRNRNRLLLTAALILAAALTLQKLANLHNEQFNPWARSPAAVANSESRLRTEEEVLSVFLSRFKTGVATPVVAPPTVVPSALDTKSVKMCFAVAMDCLGELRKRLQKTSEPATEANRQERFLTLRYELNLLKNVADLAQLLPVWQLATAMEGLLLQLSHIAGSATPSTLRTFADGLDVLQDLYVTGAREDLFTNPPLRLLAVDDDLICRKAVSFSLKKALSEPDLAESGEVALALAEKNAYDVVFLDVQMPGMDGYEVCTKIHQTLPNSNTPVVFVTVCSGFEARGQSILSGGSGLIAKPFLTFEITVKALTFCLQGAAPTARSDRRRLPPRK